MSRPDVVILGRPDRRDLGDSAAEFLAFLGGPAVLHVPGRDRTRRRGVSVLLHGNEPSGLHGLRAWLLRDETPAVDLVCTVAAVDAAGAAPGFAHRQLPGRRDLNRCFAAGAADGRDHRIAAALLDAYRARPLEALIDLHNNTGHNPAYGVATSADPACLALVSMFSDICVHTDLRLGTLIEVVAEQCPSVAIECGRAGDPAADEVAELGLGRFAAVDRLVKGGESFASMRVFRDPIRVELCPGVRLAFAQAPVPGADLTLSGEIDRLNFRPLPPRTAIGWLGGARSWPFDARAGDGLDRSRELFAIRDGRVETVREIVPIMMTSDPAIAASDCLCYVVAAA